MAEGEDGVKTWPNAMDKLNRVTLLDDTKRPKAPKYEGVTLAQRRMGNRLRQFHNMHRAQLLEVHLAMQAIDQDTAELARKISGLNLRASIQNFGNLCGLECQMLSGHHGIEDAYIFPHLHHNADAAMKKVVERLAAEHLVIHDLLGELDKAARTAGATPDAASYAKLKVAFTDLYTAVLSHFGYEETELEEALGVFGVEV
jgi:iron-sulfur cluster repair protein YtfE (RIC family)